MVRRKNIIITIIVVVAILLTISWGVGQQINTNSGKITDKDTGEVFDPKVNNRTTGGNTGTGNIKLFGIEPLIKKLIDEKAEYGYVDDIKNALYKYSSSNLDNKYSSLTLKPQSLTISSAELTGEVRLGQTDTIIPIKATISSNGKHSIVYLNKDASTFKGVYIYVGGIDTINSLLYSVSQNSTTSTALTIDTFTGYRELALGSITNLGYAVPDLNITFTNYENPFK
jgi:hypothetical protein